MVQVNISVGESGHPRSPSRCLLSILVLGGWCLDAPQAQRVIFPFILALGGRRWSLEPQQVSFYPSIPVLRRIGQRVESGAQAGAFPSIPVLCGIGWSLKTQQVPSFSIPVLDGKGRSLDTT